MDFFLPATDANQTEVKIINLGKQNLWRNRIEQEELAGDTADLTDCASLMESCGVQITTRDVPAEREWRGVFPTFCLSRWLSRGGPEGVNRWSSQLGHESFTEGRADLCSSVVSATSGESHSMAIQEQEQKTTLLSWCFTLGSIQNRGISKHRLDSGFVSVSWHLVLVVL